MDQRRLAIIGLDALEQWDLDRLIESGAVPHIEKFLATSRRVTLSCQAPYRAESIWTEVFTGRQRHENGYWTTAVFDPSTYDTWVEGAYRGNPFYARPDVVPVVLDIPHSPISPEARGVQVTAWGAHSPQFPTASRPSNVAAQIDEEFGVNGAVRSDSQAGWHNADYQQGLADALAHGARTKAKIVPWLLERQPDWNLSITVFTESHVSGHQFWHGIDRSHRLFGTPEADRAKAHHDAVMSATDAAVGDLLRGFPDDVEVMLVAANGMQTNGSDVTGGVLLAELLHRHHLGRPLIDFGPFDPDDPPIVMPPHLQPIDRLANHLVEARGTMQGSPRLGRATRAAMAAARRRAPGAVRSAEELYWKATGRSSRRDWWEILDRAPADPFVDVAKATARRPLDYQVPCWYRHRWPEMSTFVLPSFSDGHIRVNLRGREASGMVDASDYAQVLDDTEALIRSCTDAHTGESVVDEVHRPRIDDPFDPDGPTSDLIVSFTCASEAIRHPDHGVIGPSPLMRSGEHTPNGWVAMGSNGTGATEATQAPHDIAPTVIEMLGKQASPHHTGSSFADRLARSE